MEKGAEERQKSDEETYRFAISIFLSSSSVLEARRALTFSTACC